MIKINQKIINIIDKNIIFFEINKNRCFFMHLSPNNFYDQIWIQHKVFIHSIHSSLFTNRNYLLIE